MARVLQRLLKMIKLTCTPSRRAGHERCQGLICLHEALQWEPEVESRAVPIWTVQVFSSSTQGGAGAALAAASEFAPQGTRRGHEM